MPLAYEPVLNAECDMDRRRACTAPVRMNEQYDSFRAI
jgi:hypothetical protein